MTKEMEEISSEILDGEVINAALVSFVCYGFINRIIIFKWFILSQYNQIIAQLERLVEERNSYIAEEFVMKHRKVIPKITMMDNVVEVLPQYLLLGFQVVWPKWLKPVCVTST